MATVCNMVTCLARAVNQLLKAVFQPAEVIKSGRGHLIFCAVSAIARRRKKPE